MRIVYLSTHSNLSLSDKSGYATHMREIIKSFKSEGHAVLELIAGDQDKSGENISSPTLDEGSGMKKLKRFIPKYIWESGKDWTNIKYNRKIFRKYLEKISRFRPDIIYERSSYLHNAGVKISEDLGIPLVLEVNSPWPEERYVGITSFFKKRGKEIEKEKFSKAAHITTVSSTLKRYIASTGGINLTKISVIPNGANLEIFNTRSNDGKAIREKYGLKEKNVVGFVGSFFQWHSKGIKVLLEAVQSLVKDYPRVHLLIVGGGEEQDEVLKREYELANFVTFIGKVDYSKIAEFIAAMDIAVMANTNWYSSPIKIFEYGAMGKAIIAPNSEPVREVMEDGEDGILITPGSVRELSDAILALAKNPALRKRLGRHFQKKVFENYTWYKIVEKILEVIDDEIRE